MEPAQQGQDSFSNPQQSSMLSQMEAMLSTKFNCFRQELQESQRDYSEAQLSKIAEMSADSHKFKRKGNEEQYKINSKIAFKLKEGQSALQENPTANGFTQRASEKIAEGIELLAHRQKLIKLADSSETGWKVVDEYDTNALASDSEDEKRIIRAENRAQRKARTQRAFRGRRAHPYGAPRQHTFEQRDTPVMKPTPSTQRPGLCFGCGRPGHWRAECFKLQTTQGQDNKISKSTICEVNVVHELVHACPLDSTGKRIAHVDMISDGVQRSQVRSPLGMLKSAIDEWESIDACPVVLDVIKSGYKLPLHSLPSDVFLRNNRSSLDNRCFVEEEIDSLLMNGCIREVEMKPVVINPLTVAGNREKLRLVLDCRHINPFLYKFAFRYEDSSVALDMFGKGDFLFTFDLKSAYHHIEIFPDHQTYLGFAWNFDGKVRYFVFNVLPFGLSTAGYIFSKVTRELVKYWRSGGHKVIMYLDDGLGGHRNETSALDLSVRVHKDLSRFGFLIAENKCEWEPNQEATWLGLRWNMADGKVHITEKRLVKLEATAKAVLDSVSVGRLGVSARVLAGVVGQIISMSVAMGSVVRLMTRYMYTCVLARAGWDSLIYINKEALDELRFWVGNVRLLNGRLVHGVNKHDVSIYSDASGTGYGGYVLDVSDSEVIGTWSDSERKESSTWRELEAVVRMLRHYTEGLVGPRLVGRKLLWFTDSQNVANIISNGSRKKDLQVKARQIQDMCINEGYDIVTSWIPRAENKLADMYSKSGDSDDWGIRSDVFLDLNAIWGPFTIDRFASTYNAKCDLFNSRWWCPGTVGVDGLMQVWAGHNNWLVPPPRLIPKVVNKLLDEQAEATLVVPYWTSAPFWPVVAPIEGRFACFIKAYRCLPPDAVIQGKGNNGVFGGGNVPSMVALRIVFG